MFHANLILFILIGVLCSTITSLAEKDSLCGRREVWRHCEKCPQTCIPPVHCTKTCVGGCHCKRRYVRGPSGDCIYPAECHIIKNLDSILSNAR